ncbi:hypothetical protein QMG83_13080 [Salinibacterium sp. G-O1]|uniref:hypothetical protein n=1 Tax=Salinibacterium sp. G-O1 TaxID=3046208 RepID=UPI0024BAC9F7|nr:hypothetical protein [Salinibacterium sp. G-O1]MDJ0336159.1 hypothetical protein [Salinibacterium sp. G-O1]
MELTGAGGGLMLAIAAALWLAYLVPNWFKRREYLATERNAVRLQQTIRVLAESAEIPDAVRANLAAKQLAQAQRAELRQGPVAVGPVRPAQPAEDPRALAARRLRRSRAVFAAVLLVAIVATVVQLALIVTAGAVVASWVVLAVSTAAGLGSLSLLGRLAAAAHDREIVSTPRARRTSMSRAPARTEVVAEREASWTPVPVPKPLYLSRSLAPTAAVADPSAALKLASAQAEHAVRSAQQEVTTVQVEPPAPVAAPSRFARMGIVDDATTAAPDIDAVLARRRAVG